MSQSVQRLIEPLGRQQIPSQCRPVAVEAHAAALNHGQHDGVRWQRPADVLADRHVPALGPLNVEDVQAIRRQQIGEWREDADEEQHRSAEAKRQPLEDGDDGRGDEHEKERDSRQQEAEKRPRVVDEVEQIAAEQRDAKQQHGRRGAFGARDKGRGSGEQNHARLELNQPRPVVAQVGDRAAPEIEAAQLAIAGSERAAVPEIVERRHSQTSRNGPGGEEQRTQNAASLAGDDKREHDRQWSKIRPREHRSRHAHPRAQCRPAAGRQREVPRKQPPRRDGHIAHRLERLKDEDRTERHQNGGDKAGASIGDSHAQQVGEPHAGAGKQRNDEVRGRRTGDHNRGGHGDWKAGGIRRHDPPGRSRTLIAERCRGGADDGRHRSQRIGSRQMSGGEEFCLAHVPVRVGAACREDAVADRERHRCDRCREGNPAGPSQDHVPACGRWRELGIVELDDRHRSEQRDPEGLVRFSRRDANAQQLRIEAARHEVPNGDRRGDERDNEETYLESADSQHQALHHRTEAPESSSQPQEVSRYSDRAARGIPAKPGLR